jgi:hypothetical protein
MNFTGLGRIKYSSGGIDSMEMGDNKWKGARSPD